MRSLTTWRISAGSTELLRYDPEQIPSNDDIERFLKTPRVAPELLPFQSKRYVLRRARWASAWLRTYINCHSESLKATYVGADTSFYIALLENDRTGDRSIAFRLTASELPGYTQWTVSFRRVRIDGTDDHFLCAE
jgi:hypothetical protein